MIVNCFLVCLLMKMKLVNSLYGNECTAGSDNCSEVLNLSMKK